MVYFESGQLKQKGVYVNGKSHGLWSYYHPNGNLWKRGAYVSNNQEGIWHYYNEFNDPENIILYSHGLMQGIAMVNKYNIWKKVLIENGEVVKLFNEK